jgi:hypothetical protein
MRRSIACIASLVVLSFSALFAIQKTPYPLYTNEEDNPAPIPPDCNEQTEWAFARLRYPSGRFSSYTGTRGTWPTDFPKADRQFVQGVRRLTRLHARSMEQVVDINSDELFNWPWIYAVEVGHWDLTEAQCKRLREYFLRGGFLVTDDFHGSGEWNVFMASMSRIFPDKPVVEISDQDPIFHVIYDLNDRIQVPGIQYWYSGHIWEKDGKVPHWRGIYDDKGRVMVAICFNQDNGDAWEWADSPRYPEKYTSQAYRMGIDYIIYALTH